MIEFCARLFGREGLELALASEENQGSNESAECRAAENQTYVIAFHLLAFRSMFD
jgi:hypothetical protein